LNTFELNKIAGACLGTLLFAMWLNVISGAIFGHTKLVKPGYPLPSAQEVAAAGSGAATPSIEPIEQRLATADVQKGQTDTKPCQACHNLDKGAGAKIGPPALRCRRPAQRLGRGFRLFRGDQVQGRRMDL